MTPKDGGGDHHRHDGKTVETIGEVDRIAGADDDEAAEQDEEIAEIEHEVLEEGEGQRRAESRAGRPPTCGRIMKKTAMRGDDELDAEARLAGKALVRLLRHLEIVVVEADGAETERHQQHRPRHRRWKDRPRAATTDDAREDHQPAHGRRAGLLEMVCGPSARIGWPLPCRTRSDAIIRGPNRKTMIAEVNRAAPVRKVMYRKRLKN